MTKVLYITAHPQVNESLSYSLTVGKAFLETYRESNPYDEVVHVDLYRENIPYIDADVFSGWGKLQNGTALTEVEQQKVERLSQLVNQFVEADKYVFVTPMWNFSFPPLMKAYIDAITVAGKTFKYTEDGPVGLLVGKKAVHIQASGGIYSHGPAADMEMGNRHLRVLMKFLGIENFQSIFVEGHALMPNKAAFIKEKAIEQAKKVAKEF